jgi:hypothetical protein
VFGGRSNGMVIAMFCGMVMFGGWVWFCHPEAAAKISSTAGRSSSGTLLLLIAFIGVGSVGVISRLASEWLGLAGIVIKVGLIFGAAIIAVNVWNARSLRPAFEAVESGRDKAHQVVRQLREGGLTENRATPTALDVSQQRQHKTVLEATVEEAENIQTTQPVQESADHPAERSKDEGWGSMWWSDYR